MKRIYKILSVLIAALGFAFGITTAAFAEGEAAQGATSIASSPIPMIIMLVLLGVVFYFFMYRPQKKQERQVNEMRSNLSVGDEVCTNAGIIGRIVRIKDDIITLELGSDKTKMKVFNWAIREVLLPADAPEDEEPKKPTGDR